MSVSDVHRAHGRPSTRSVPARDLAACRPGRMHRSRCVSRLVGPRGVGLVDRAVEGPHPLRRPQGRVGRQIADHRPADAPHRRRHDRRDPVLRGALERGEFGVPRLLSEERRREDVDAVEGGESGRLGIEEVIADEEGEATPDEIHGLEAIGELGVTVADRRVEGGLTEAYPGSVDDEALVVAVGPNGRHHDGVAMGSASGDRRPHGIGVGPGEALFRGDDAGAPLQREPAPQHRCPRRSPRRPPRSRGWSSRGGLGWASRR